MKKILIALFVIVQVSLLMTPSRLNAQTEEKEKSFSREQGYFIRPELYGAVLAEFGYQINPNLQFSLGGGVELGDSYVIPELVLGARAYATDTKWTAFFDYHLGVLLFGDIALPTHRFTVGPSYKNFDFGGGIMYMYANAVGGIWAPCLNIGFNFRFPKK